MLEHLRLDIRDMRRTTEVAKELDALISGVADRNEALGGHDYLERRHFTLIRECPKESEAVKDEYQVVVEDCMRAMLDVGKTIYKTLSSVVDNDPEFAARKARHN